MFKYTRNVKRTQRGIIILGTAAILVFGIYSNGTILRANLKDILPLKVLTNDFPTVCKLLWRDSKVSVEFYEAPRIDHSKIEKNHFVTNPRPVESLYPDPVVRLNPERFLLPIVYNGPNNQITGLREATYVAIKLNRTLVLPRFFKHFSDSSVTSRKEWYIYPGHRLSMENYCKFVSCVTIEQFQEACGNQVDAMIHLQTFQNSDIRDWESYTGMKIARTKEQEGNLDVKLIPPTSLEPGTRARKFKSTEIDELFTSEERCVLYPRPLYNLQLHAMVIEKNNYDIELVRSQTDVARLSDSRLFLSICNASGAPRYIKDIAKDFIETNVKNRPFVSVHWRYNKDDFMKRCNSNSGNKLKMQLCANAMLIKPDDIARSIEQKVAQLRQDHLNFNVRDIYFASPPSERKMAAGIALLLYQRHGWLTHSSLDLEKFMNDRYRSCDAIEKHFNDILSTTEMEICGLGTAFMGSARSSWSSNVHLARKASKEERTRPQMDGDVYKMSVSVMEQQDEEQHSSGN